MNIQQRENFTRFPDPFTTVLSELRWKKNARCRFVVPFHGTEEASSELTATTTTNDKCVPAQKKQQKNKSSFYDMNGTLIA